MVAIARCGAVLKDGTKIKPSKLRGLYSYGMALGKVDVEVGRDLSDIYCQQYLVSTTAKLPFIKWTSVELLHNVRNDLKILGKTPIVTYRAKIKLHGTNAGVQITPDGEVAAQKRTQIINSKSDNAGFATWVEQNIDYFKQLKRETTITIFGEWCGSKVQKGVAISQIGRKVLAVFAIQCGGVSTQPKLEIRPEKIREMLPQHQDIFVLPYYGEAITLDFGDRLQLQCASDIINKMVEKVEAIDPWVKETFGVEGVGEGLVMYPETEGVVIREGYTELMFKAKGEKHRVVKSKEAVRVDPEVAQNIEAFVELFVTEARLQQALTEACNGELNIKKMGQFLKWIARDIKKESSVELAASGLTWKDVHKRISNAARVWYSDSIAL
ncbi:RNA ligase family protein [Waterburya agarophytonicola]|uniref:RNA ligase family protein n=1 Tax=Waterburya agarophytonicola TaxID=2886916 RepID=UPI001E568A90|nr:RNA ligase family protein [Waterburya agarophytonicola]